MLKYTTAGESHGKALTGIIEGLPAGIRIDRRFVAGELKRRRRAAGRSDRQSIETDRFEITSGVRRGKTTGGPIAIAIINSDSRLDKIPPINRPRPGHVDLAGALKYATTDARNAAETASGRLTAIRVALGAVARLFLREFGIESLGYVRSIGRIYLAELGPGTDLGYAKKKRSSDLYAIGGEAAAVRAQIKRAAAEGDSLGGTVTIAIDGVPAGLGRTTGLERLDSLLAAEIAAIPAVKGIELGAGFLFSCLSGKDIKDNIAYKKGARPTSGGISHDSNPSGGIEGGISNGERLEITLAVRAVPTVVPGKATINLKTKKRARANVERSDVTAVPAVSVVAENVTALPLARAFLDKFGGDTVAETKANYENFLRTISRL